MKLTTLVGDLSSMRMSPVVDVAVRPPAAIPLLLVLVPCCTVSPCSKMSPADVEISQPLMLIPHGFVITPEAEELAFPTTVTVPDPEVESVVFPGVDALVSSITPLVLKEVVPIPRINIFPPPALSSNP